MAELQLTQADLAGIQGSGNAGRVTIKDLESFLGGLEKQTAEDASAIRTGVADAMRRSWTRPLATVGFSVCLDPVLEDRKKRDPKPGPGFVCLCARSLSRWRKRPPRPSRLIGGRALRSESIDIGVAVEAQDGIMVPVIRSADKTSFGDLTSRYTELVDLARPPPGDLRDDIRRDRVGFKFRHLRSRLGHAHSPARSNAAARPRRRAKKRRPGARRSSSSFPRRKPNSPSASITAASTAAAPAACCSASSNC